MLEIEIGLNTRIPSNLTTVISPDPAVLPVPTVGDGVDSTRSAAASPAASSPAASAVPPIPNAGTTSRSGRVAAGMGSIPTLSDGELKDFALTELAGKINSARAAQGHAAGALGIIVGIKKEMGGLRTNSGPEEVEKVLDIVRSAWELSTVRYQEFDEQRNTAANGLEGELLGHINAISADLRAINAAPAGSKEIAIEKAAETASVAAQALLISFQNSDSALNAALNQQRDYSKTFGL
jgi:hypothetical protein